MISFFDSHAHLSSAELFPQVDSIILRAEEASVKSILNICTDRETLRNGFAIETRFPQVKNGAAAPPQDGGQNQEEMFSLVAEAARGQKLAAIGETGLDYYYPGFDRAVQKKSLVKYLHLALECRLPVIFHCRDAFSDLFEIVDAEYGPNAPAVVHCFTGTREEGEKVLERKWHLSLSGIVTFKKSSSLREIAKIVPLNQLLIETDSPYLAPQRRRGKQNEPSFLPETAEIIALAKGISLEEIGAATFANAVSLFGPLPSDRL